MKALRPYIDLVLVLLSLAGYYGLQNLIPRTDFPILFSIYTVLFGAYAYWSFVRRPGFKQILIVGLLFRLCMLTATPNWSNDYYRFYWDAQMSLNGINPYDLTPTQLQERNPAIFETHKDLYAELNSPDYYSVYPSVLQGFFTAGAWLGGSIDGFVKTMQVFIVLAELLTVWLMSLLLSLLRKPPSLSALYFLNPLIVLELSGNLHNEVFMVLFVVLALWLGYRKQWIWSALALALATACKLYPVLLAPLFLIQARKSWWQFGASFALSMSLLFFPLIGWQEWVNIKSSIDLYFQKFEFNGGLYFLLRKCVTYFTQFNPIEFLGPSLGVVSLVLMLKTYHAFWKKPDAHNLFTLVGAIVFIFYATSTTVHPWYLSLLIAMSVFSKWRFAIVWSFLIVLTYYTYSTTPYSESYAMVAIGWIGSHGFLLWEYFQHRKAQTGELSQ